MCDKVYLCITLESATEKFEETLLGRRLRLEEDLTNFWDASVNRGDVRSVTSRPPNAISVNFVGHCLAYSGIGDCLGRRVAGRSVGVP